jgi:hypothetical protein
MLDPDPTGRFLKKMRKINRKKLTLYNKHMRYMKIICYSYGKVEAPGKYQKQECEFRKEKIELRLQTQVPQSKKNSLRKIDVEC